MDTTDADVLKQIAGDFWNWKLNEAPEFATCCDIHTYNNKLESQSPEALKARVEKCKDFASRLEKIDCSRLLTEDGITFQQMKAMLACVIDGFKWRHYGFYNAINFLENTPISWSGFILDSTRFDSLDDFRMYNERLRAIPKQISEQIQLMSEAIEAKTTNHAVSVERIIQQYNEILAKTATESIFYQPMKTKLPNIKGLTCEIRSDIEKQCAEIITKNIFPSLISVRDFIMDTYIPQSRSGYGVGSLPNGKEYYQESLKWHLTIDMDPQEVHDIGLKEVSRIREKMDQIKAEVRFSGTLNDFVVHMRNNKDFFMDSTDKLLKEYNDIVYNQIDPKLSSMFKIMPSQKVVVREMPFNGPGGMYFPPSTDGSRPGVFFANLNKPEERPTFTMVSLSLHESSPGHHFQLARQVESDLPSFRKEIDWRSVNGAPFLFPMYTAYIEGWGLYAEALGEELNVYRNPYDMFGRYLEELFRAARLVIDTGLHVFGWSRQQAIEYLMANSCDPLEQIEIEIDRYITWPGQACAYKIGEIRIRDLRKKAEVELGPKFDIKEFHEVILRSGAMTLTMLENIVNKWICENY